MDATSHIFFIHHKNEDELAQMAFGMIVSYIQSTLEHNLIEQKVPLQNMPYNKSTPLLLREQLIYLPNMKWYALP